MGSGWHRATPDRAEPVSDRTGAADGATLDLRILATTDLHVQLMPHDYHADRPAPEIGLARTAVLIDEERALARNAILLDNGDFLQGNPMADYVAETYGIAPGAVHPAIAAMNALGYDAAALGNHEFNYGLQFLADALSAARFPIVAANVEPLVPDAAIALPFAMLNRDAVDRDGRRWPLRIAVAGFLPPQIAVWDHPHLNGRLVAHGIVETARRLVPQLLAAGADLVVALCHSGLGDDDDPDTADPGAENAALSLARVPGIDAVVAGHSHLVFPAPGPGDAAGLLAGKPAVMPGFGGSHLGVIDLTLTRGPDARWRVTAGRGRVRAIADLPDEASWPPVVAAAARAHDATRAHMQRPVGATAVPLTTYAALAEPSDAVALIAEAQRAHVAAALADGPHAGLPVLSAAAPFRSGGRGGPLNYTDIPAGLLTLRHLSDLSPYPNTICALRLTGAQVKAWLVQATACYRRIAPGSVEPLLIDTAIPGYNCDSIAGLRYTIDLAMPVGPDRVRDITLDGRPLADDRPVILATNSYRAMGGGRFPGACPEAVVLAGTETIRDVLARYLGRVGCFSRAPTAPRWRFAPMAGTAVIIETGPGVAGHLAGSAMTLAGAADGGFVKVRLPL